MVVPKPRHGVWQRWVLIGIVMAYVAFLILAPIAGLIVGAFQEGLGAAVEALTDPDLLSAFGRTLYIAVIAVVIHTIFGTSVAWVLARSGHRFPGRGLINGLIDLPFAMSPVVVGYLLLLLFGRRGLLAPVLQALDIQVAFAMPGMILATLFVTLPFMIRELMPVLEAFDVEQEHAAATLGANGWQTFWRVTLPALRWGFVYGIALTFARALGEFGAVLVIGGGLQGGTDTATLYVFHALEARQYVAAFSAALVLGVFSLALVLGTDLLRKRTK